MKKFNGRNWKKIGEHGIFYWSRMFNYFFLVPPVYVMIRLKHSRLVTNTIPLFFFFSMLLIWFSLNLYSWVSSWADRYPVLASLAESSKSWTCQRTLDQGGKIQTLPLVMVLKIMLPIQLIVIGVCLLSGGWLYCWVSQKVWL